MENNVAILDRQIETKYIKNMPFCPVCHDVEENKGSQNIKVCKKCRKILLNKLK
jgi:ribosomal protein L37AE/L43A